MADLSSALRRIGKGAAAESASSYFGEELQKRLRRAEGEVDAAFSTGDDTRLKRAVAEWLVVRGLIRGFARDIADGQAAQKEVAQ